MKFCRYSTLIQSALAVLILSGSSASAQHSHDDPRLEEHMDFVALFPDSAANYRAVASGNWSNPATWNTNQVPLDNAKIIVPTGTLVTFDVPSSARIKLLRVDGTLKFSTNNNTKLRVDTLLVPPSGRLEVGSKTTPISASALAEIVIIGNGPIDRSWDPKQMSRGVVSHGEVSVHGIAKSSFHKFIPEPSGTTSIELLESPKNWVVGDTIVLSGTHFLGDSFPGNDVVWKGSEDEHFTIKSIKGKVIELDHALQFDHTVPKPEFYPYVGNLSRNVKFSTENFASVPIAERGHVMFMHSNKVDVRYAQFRGLGRTNKFLELDDFALNNGERISDGNGGFVRGPSDNIRGRYPFHFHRIGTSYKSNPAIALGNVVWGAPGWAFVHHDSYALFEDNISYDSVGAAYVAETGNEIGHWIHNLALRSNGIRGGVKAGDHNSDVGRIGTGFWFQGRLVAAERNVVAGMQSHGYAYFHRGIDNLKNATDTLTHPEFANFAGEVFENVNPIDHFIDNEAFAVGSALG